MNVLETLVSSFCNKSGHDTPDVNELNTLFAERGDFLAQLKIYDAWMGRHTFLEPVEPYLFDLFMTEYMRRESFFNEEDYWESEEWSGILDQVEDRGSEWLNLLIYFVDCTLNEVDPDAEDFLNEFLLVEEDDQQDEYEIYEPFILLQGFIGDDTENILAAVRQVDSDELGAILPALMLFFSEVEEAEGLTPVESALLSATWAAYQEETKRAA
jgi:hypothetical protein